MAGRGSGVNRALDGREVISEDVEGVLLVGGHENGGAAEGNTQRGGESRTRGGVERAVEKEVFSGSWLTAASAHEPFGLAYLLSDPRATKPTLCFLADLGRFDSLYSPPSDDPSS